MKKKNSILNFQNCKSRVVKNTNTADYHSDYYKFNISVAVKWFWLFYYVQKSCYDHLIIICFYSRVWIKIIICLLLFIIIVNFFLYVVLVFICSMCIWSAWCNRYFCVIYYFPLFGHSFLEKFKRKSFFELKNQILAHIDSNYRMTYECFVEKNYLKTERVIL